MNEHELNTQMLGEIATMISDDVPRTEGLCTTADSVRWLRDKLRETKRERDDARAELLEARVRSARLLERSGLGQAIINGIIKKGMVRAVEPQLSVFKADAAEHLEAVVADWQENSVKCENCENYVLDYATDPEGIVVCIECNEGLEGETK